MYAGEYEINNNLYLVNKRLCRVYLPPLYMDKKKYYWIQYDDDKDVTIVPCRDLLPISTIGGKVLFKR